MIRLPMLALGLVFCVAFFGCHLTKGMRGGETPGTMSSRPVGGTSTSTSPDGTTAPAPISMVQPKYPEAAIEASLEGTVYTKLLVEPDGSVSQALISKSDNPIFDEAALEAARQWTFTPGKDRNGNPTKVWTTIPLRFKLK